MGRVAIGGLVGVALTLVVLFFLGLLRPPSEPRVPQNAPEFRHAVREVVEASLPSCRLSTLAENDFIMAPAKAQLSNFRKSLDGSLYAEQFDIAEADAEYILSISQVECQVPDSQRHPDQLRRAALAETLRHIKGVEALLRD